MKFTVKKVLLLMLLGALLYLLLGAILPFTAHPEVSEETRQAVAETAYTGSEQGTERARIIADNGEALTRRLQMISQAKERIILSTFDIRSDESGKDVLAALIAAADRGVEVKLVVDGFCGFTRMTGDPYFVALSARKNAEIKIYNPVNPLKPWTLMARLHDKYLIVDNTAYLLGGRNTHDYFLGDHDGKQNYDWDVLVWQEEDRPDSSLHQLLDYFAEVWDSPACHLYHDDVQELEKKRVVEAQAELASRLLEKQETHPDWFAPMNYRHLTLPTRQVRLVSNPIHTGAKEPTAFYTITELMARGEESVVFHTPYMICNGWMMERLEKVCQQVPEVTMMTNSVANNGNSCGAMDYRLHKGEILETGTKVLEYDGGISHHGKCFAVDDHLAVVGSFNWDMRSAYIDTELMVVMDSPEVTEALRREMSRYEDAALTVVDEDTSIAPEGHTPQQMGTMKRFVSNVLGLVADWARFLM